MIGMFVSQVIVAREADDALSGPAGFMLTCRHFPVDLALHCELGQTVFNRYDVPKGPKTG